MLPVQDTPINLSPTQKENANRISNSNVQEIILSDNSN
jgi:hypothetical protein